MAPKVGDRVVVLRPLELKGCTGLVQVPLWCPDEGERRIGVYIDCLHRLEWVTDVEIAQFDRYRVDG